MRDKNTGYFTIDVIEDLDMGKSIGKIVAEDLDNMIARDIVGVFKEYFPKSTIDEKLVLKFTRMLMAEEKGIEKGGAE